MFYPCWILLSHTLPNLNKVTTSLAETTSLNVTHFQYVVFEIILELIKKVFLILDKNIFIV